MRRTFLALALVSGSVLPAAAVCPGATVLYEDSFDRLQPTWSDVAGAAVVGNGQLSVTPGTALEVWLASSAGVYDDLDMCVNVTTVKGVVPDEAKAGLVFWYEDENNFYVFQLSPNGKASVLRRQRGKWLDQVRWKDAENASQGDGAVNELRVTIKGGDAVFFVNGGEFAKLEATAPENGQQIGLFAASPESEPATFAFDDLRVTKP